jgi:tetratricopeptide (TPR) repeat protein
LLALVALGIWQYRTEQQPPPPSDEPPDWVPHLAEALKRAAQPEPPARPTVPAPPSTPRPTPGDEFTYDVFVSYSSTERTWVRGELLQHLEEAGPKVCIDYRDFKPGAPSASEMERAVSTSRRTLLILTPAYLESAWTEFETMMLQVLDPANHERRLIPLLREVCDLPLHIRYLTYVDFAHPEDWNIAWVQLLTALGAPPQQEAPEPPARESWCLKHPYPMPPNFTGRAVERKMLSAWLEADAGHPLLMMRALGGFGKSALAWHWLLHDVDPAHWPRVVWWNFYDDSNFDTFLRETLEYLAEQGATHLRGALHLNPRQQAENLLRCLHQPGTLLILDGFERALRAYGRMDAAYQGDDVGQTANLPNQTDCVSPITEHFLRSVASLPDIRSKVLLTTRLRPHVLEAVGGELLTGCREVELTQMQPADAVAFFRTRGVRGARAEIQRACAPYGYHPLSLRLLAGLVMRDPQQPGDISAARRLDVSGDLVQRQHHVLETAYTSLDPEQQKLLSTIACFRGPVGYEALEQTLKVSADGTSDTFRVSDLDAALRELVDRGLLHHDRKTGKYDLHPIVRRYAYDQLGGAARTEAHGHLRDYFAAVPPPDRVQTLDDLAPVIELYHHTVRAGQYDEAITLFRDRINQTTYYQFGAYQLRIELLLALFPDGEEQPPRLKDESDQAWTLNALANSYSLSGQPRRAVPLFEQMNASFEKRGDKRNLVSGLENLAYMAQIHIGALRAGEADLRQAMILSREIEDEFSTAVEHSELGRLLACRGAWAEAKEELAAALAPFEKQRHVQSQGITWAYRAQRALLQARHAALTGDPKSQIENRQSAIDSARRALELADEYTRTRHPHPRDYVRAHWLLGAAHRANGDLNAAERHLSEALTRCRGINMVEHEADILLDLARLRHATLTPGPSPSPGRGGLDEVQRLAEEALLITERCGYVLQGADVHLFLAQIEIERGDREKAADHARQARELATCDGPPDYTYKVAYEEAGALLARLQAEA